MNKSIKLLIHQWVKIKEILRQDYPLSVLSISWKTKEVLGFSVRSEYNLVHLDFVDEKKKTFFLLRYSDHIPAQPKSTFQTIKEKFTT